MLTFHFFRDVLLLRIAERPNFVAFYSLGFQTLYVFIMVLLATRSHIDKQTRSALAEPVKARGFDIRHD